MRARNLTGEAFLSLGGSAVSGRDVFSEGGILALAEGEIRNRDALLASVGARSPAELILRLYSRWGADYVRRVEGPVATAVMDRAEGRLILSRDRAGAIPLYYAWRGRSVTFAGRAEYLLRSGAAGRTVDADGLNALFCAEAPPAPGRTPFRDIRKLEPGGMLISDARGTRTRRYFSLTATETENAREEMEALIAGNMPPRSEECAFDRDWIAFSDGETFRAEFSEDEPRFSGIGGEALWNLLADSLLACGFPGDPAEGARIQWLCSAAAAAKKTIVSGAGGAYLASPPPYVPGASGAESGAYRFLKPSLVERLRPRKYAENRIREIVDRLPVNIDEAPDERCARTNFHIAAALLAPESGARWAHTSSRAGARVCMPFLDERVISRLWGMRPAERNALLGVPRAASGIPLAPFSRVIREEALRVAADPANPLCRFLDIDAFEAEARRDSPDAEALLRLIQINLWFLQTDAEENL